MPTSAELQKQAEAQVAAQNAKAAAMKQQQMMQQQGQQQSSEFGQKDLSHAAETQYKYLDPTLATRDKYNAQAEARRMASIKALMASSSGGGAGGGGGDAGPAFNEQAARDAAFARAKDQAGSIARSSLDALTGHLQSRGRMGGAFEAEKSGQVIGGAANGLGEFNRDQLMLDLNRGAQVADRNYAGNLTKRQQDIQKQNSLMSLYNVSGAVY